MLSVSPYSILTCHRRACCSKEHISWMAFVHRWTTHNYEKLIQFSFVVDGSARERERTLLYPPPPSSSSSLPGIYIYNIYLRITICARSVDSLPHCQMLRQDIRLYWNMNLFYFFCFGSCWWMSVSIIANRWYEKQLKRACFMYLLNQNICFFTHSEEKKEEKIMRIRCYCYKFPTSFHFVFIDARHFLPFLFPIRYDLFDHECTQVDWKINFLRNVNVSTKYWWLNGRDWFSKRGISIWDSFTWIWINPLPLFNRNDVNCTETNSSLSPNKNFHLFEWTVWTMMRTSPDTISDSNWMNKTAIFSN